ncbi:MAG: hypothetical protein IJJ74_07405 [Eubacterium sp.]|nr:hypothetical protein [Eubacterium sp.]
MIYYVYKSFRTREVDVKTATNKATEDVNAILSSIGAQPYEIILPVKKRSVVSLVKNHIYSIMSFKKLISKLKHNDIVVIQHPKCGSSSVVKFLKSAKRKQVKTVLLIHDLYLLRDNIESGDKQVKFKKNEKIILTLADNIICHNASMHKYIEDLGISNEKLIDLGIFDYLYSGEIITERTKTNSFTVAGNLSPNKAGYIYDYMNSNQTCEMNLFGVGFDSKDGSGHTHYFGAKLPNELPQHLIGSFGLVWDGPSAETCSGNTGNYLRYNNPHKCSLYLASNLPVVIWDEAALAPFIKENGLGITVQNLGEIADAINQISEKEYNDILKNVMEVGNKIRSGYYLKEAFSQIAI